MQERKLKISGFLAKYFRNYQLGEDDDIFALGFVNSLLALQLVSFLEKEFDIVIEDDDLNFDNFRTVNNMDALIAKKQLLAVGTAASAALSTPA